MATHKNPNFPISYRHILDRTGAIEPIQYSKTRNFTDGAVTQLSPYISRGVISVKQVLDSVLARGYKLYEIERFLQELAWREYFQRVWQRLGNGIWEDVKHPQEGVRHHRMVTAVEEARTGVDAIDEGITQLYELGYLHNHLRMYTASVTCNMGGAHWLQPAKWLYYHLLDGDIASNSLSWQWVAGAFADKKYVFNQENVNKYTRSHQRNTFLDKSYEEIRAMPLPAVLKDSREFELKTKLPVTGIPTLDTNKPTLLYNSYNLDPDWRSGEDVNRVLLLEPSHFEKNPVSEGVMAFILDLSKNIAGIQVYAGEAEAIAGIYEKAAALPADFLISKEHTAFTHYPGVKDRRDWMFPEITDATKSFFAYWKQCRKILK